MLAPRIRHLLTLLACAAALAALPSSASASHGQAVYFEAPRDLLSNSTRDHAFQQLSALGVRALRVVLYWHDVAPGAGSRRKPSFDATNPSAYNWAKYDVILQGAAQRNWQVLLTVSGPVPRWATPGGRDTVTRPDPLEFHRFMTAVGQHYGAQVKLFTIWNEPNHPNFLDPQFSGRTPLSPRIYRGLFQAGYSGLHAAPNAAGAKVLMGDTAPVGTLHDVAPLIFLRGALCLDGHYRMSSTCSLLPADGWAHHPYTTLAGPFFSPPPDDVTIGVLSRLSRALDRAAAAGAIHRHLPIYLTEFGVQSYPDPFNGVSLAQQPEFQAIAEHIAWGNPRVASFSQYLLRDDVVRGHNIFQQHSGFTTGLEMANGRQKPSYAAWPIPLVVTRHGGRVSLWGLVRPAAGSATVQVETADGRGHFRALLRHSTDRRGYWDAISSFRTHRRWRVRWIAPGGRVYLGPAIRAYDTRGRLSP